MYLGSGGLGGGGGMASLSWAARVRGGEVLPKVFSLCPVGTCPVEGPGRGGAGLGCEVGCGVAPGTPDESSPRFLDPCLALCLRSSFGGAAVPCLWTGPASRRGWGTPMRGGWRPRMVDSRAQGRDRRASPAQTWLLGLQSRWLSRPLSPTPLHRWPESAAREQRGTSRTRRRGERAAPRSVLLPCQPPDSDPIAGQHPGREAYCRPSVRAERRLLSSFSRWENGGDLRPFCPGPFESVLGVGCGQHWPALLPAVPAAVSVRVIVEDY